MWTLSFNNINRWNIQMKIAITGAMGVGKTTFANMLSAVTGIYVLPEVARDMIQEGYTLDHGATEEFETIMVNRQMLLELDDDFIADRGIIDILAYCMILFEDNQELLNLINNKLSEAEYDVVFYMAPEFPIEDDGIRSTDIKLQKQIDEAIKGILSVGNFKWFQLTGSKEKRVKKALKHLTSVK